MTVWKSFTLWIGVLIFMLCGCDWPRFEHRLRPAMRIDRSMTIEAGRYEFHGGDSLHQPIVIEGVDLVIDFNGAELVGDRPGQAPDTYAGVGVWVRGGRNITIKNLRARGYQIALLAEGVDSLKIIDCDFSYNYRQRLHSGLKRESWADWLSYHDNDHDEWKRYGAGIYLKNCDRALVRGVTITGGQNGLLMHHCHDGLIYNNTIMFNSGLGVGLYRCRGNRVQHNRLDWNVRGYSHGFYQRGQDSAGILVYEQSGDNVFAYNSATHSGDGFFLWAGNETMESGEGGCNDNIIYGNDFSFAPTNGIEVTFSRNAIVDNRIEGCTYGVWGGYSYQTEILGNRLVGNRWGVAIEHGQDNTITGNHFIDNHTGIRLWERPSQPADWGYVRRREVGSRDYRIEGNVFRATRVPLDISAAASTRIVGNRFVDFDLLFAGQFDRGALELRDNLMGSALNWGAARAFLDRNQVRADAEQTPPAAFVHNNPRVRALPDSMTVALPERLNRGREHIIIQEWGPYDFRSPAIVLRDIVDERYIFLLQGPPGNWKVVDGEGFAALSVPSGTIPATLTARKDPEAARVRLDLEFVGEAGVDPFGRPIPRGRTVRYHFRQLTRPIQWWVRWYEYGAENHPVDHNERFRALREAKAGYELETDSLIFQWRGSPGGGIDARRFGAFAEADVELPPGRYRLRLVSGDGLRLYLDGERVFDRWMERPLGADILELDLGGRHRLELEHFNAGGSPCLEVYLEDIPGALSWDD